MKCIPLLLIVLACLAPAHLFAGVFSWDDDAADTLWDTSSNWTTDAQPGIFDVAQFDNNSAAGTVDMGATDEEIRGIRIIVTSTVAWTVNGTATLTSGAQTAGYVIQNKDTLDFTLNPTLKLRDSGGDIEAEAGNINLSAIDLNGKNLDFEAYSGKTITVSGAISHASGSVDVIQGGATGLGGTTQFTGGADNTYGGDTTINIGTLQLNKTAGFDALGDGTGSITLGDGTTGNGTLEYNASNQINDSTAIDFNGGTLQASTGVTDTLGNITLSNDSVIDMGNGNITWTFGTFTYTSGILRVHNYGGSPSGAHNDQLFFTAGASNLDRILFYRDAGVSLRGYGVQLGTGEITFVPVPETSTMIYSGALLMLSGLHLYRRNRRGKATHTTAS